MYFVRPGRLDDLDAIVRMARAARPMLHSLPPDRHALAARLELSEASFNASIEAPGSECYLFVLEHASSGHLAGTAGIVAAAGHEEPFYVFRHEALIHASRELRVNRKIAALSISHELTDVTRLAGFYLEPALAEGDAAHLLSRARMLYIAAHRQRFTDDVFTLLPGHSDAAGRPPFWDAVGRKFFGGGDFATVDRLAGGRSGTFIAEVMPRYPIYVPLLPAQAQQAIGVPNQAARLAYEIHLEEGFEVARYVDIFDAGPVLMARLERTASVAWGSTRTVRAAAAGGTLHLVGCGLGDAFRCVLADQPESGADAPLSGEARAVLNVAESERVYCVPLHASLRATGRPGRAGLKRV